MAETVTVPAWLTPGAEVVLYTEGNYRRVQRGTVKTVGKMWFTVNDPQEPRFRIDRCSAVTRDAWAPTRYVVPLDSDTAREELVKAQRLALHNRARSAVQTWTRDPSPENCEAAITALQATVDRAALLADDGTS